MAVDVKSEKLTELIDPNVEVEQLATGFTFTEGPIWHPTEQVLYFSRHAGGRPPQGDAGRNRHGGAQAGLQVQRHDARCRPQPARLRARDEPARPRAPRVGRRSARSSPFHYEGKYLNSPNDVCVRSDGTIYFSDPWYGRMPGFGIERERELGWQGVFMIPPGGGQNELRLVVAQNECEMPNGLCFSPDESLLYINDTPGAYINVYDVAADGTISNGRRFAEGIGDGDLEKGGLVDGMKCDEQGNIWVTGPDGVWVFSAEGEHLGVVGIPESVGNLTWGGPDWHTLFVPASTSVYTVTTKVGPRREPYMR